MTPVLLTYNVSNAIVYGFDSDMSPKSNKELLTVRLRHGRKTVVLQVPGSSTIAKLKSDLNEALTESQLLSDDGEISGDLRIGEPEDAADLTKGWKEVENSKATLHSFSGEKSDGIDLAFVHGKDNFSVELPVNDYE
jgi:hypothetical protein